MLTNLKPYVPFSDLVRFDPFWDMNELFTFPRLRSTMSVPAMEADIPIELKENDDAYVVKAGMPGLTRDDIHVAVDGNTVSITAEVRKSTEPNKDEKVLRSEFYYGKLARTFTLMSDVDEAKTTARYDNGVLELTLPKKAGSTVHTVAVQ